MSIMPHITHCITSCVGTDSYFLFHVEDVKKGLDVHFAETYADIYKVTFPDSEYSLP